jgi:signal transduction histidine kinase
MIEQLLDFTRIRVGGGVELRASEIDLGDVCRVVIAELEAAHAQCVLRLHAHGDLHGTWDGDRLTQVLSNLATNALQHGEANGGVAFTVDGSNAESVTIHVHNRGVIPEPMRPVLFDPFRGIQGRERRGGLGLGLFIARQIVLAHAGDVRVDSSAEAGTTFTVVLPRCARWRRAPRSRSWTLAVMHGTWLRSAEAARREGWYRTLGHHLRRAARAGINPENPS